MNPNRSEALFQLALVLHAAYPYRSRYDRRSSTTIALVVRHAERVMASTIRPQADPAMGPVWQPGR